MTPFMKECFKNTKPQGKLGINAHKHSIKIYKYCDSDQFLGMLTNYFLKTTTAYRR